MSAAVLDFVVENVKNARDVSRAGQLEAAIVYLEGVHSQLQQYAQGTNHFDS